MGLQDSDAQLLPVPCPAPVPSVPVLQSLHTMDQCSQCWGVSSAPWCRDHGTGAGMGLEHCSSGQWGQWLPGSARGTQ